MEAPKQKVRLFIAAVFVSVTASVAALLMFLEQSAVAAVAVGFLVGATAAIEVGWFGGRAFFGENGSDEK